MEEYLAVSSVEVSSDKKPADFLQIDGNRTLSMAGRYMQNFPWVSLCTTLLLLGDGTR